MTGPNVSQFLAVSGPAAGRRRPQAHWRQPRPYTSLITYWTWHRAGPWREVEWPDGYGGEALKQRIIQRIEYPDEGRGAVAM